MTLGLVPLSGEVSPWLRAARRLGQSLYDFDGLRAFKAKLKPRAWDPIFLSYPPSGNGVRRDVRHADRVRARRPAAVRARDAAARARRSSMRVLAVLLLVWTALLALPIERAVVPVAARGSTAGSAFDVVLGGLAVRARATAGGAVLADLLATAVTARCRR